LQNQQQINNIFEEDVELEADSVRATQLKIREVRTQQLSEIALQVRARLRDKRDIVFAITGEEGEGKSVLSIQLARLICGTDVPFGLENNVIFDPDPKSVGKKIYDLPHFSPVIVDEAVKVAYKGNFMHGSQKFLKQLFSVCRGQYKCIILCIPNFRDLDLFFRQHRVGRWLFVVNRGMAVSLMKRRNPFDSDPWRVKENFEIVEGALKNNHDPAPSALAAAMRQTRNFQSILYFPNLEPAMLAEYERLKDEVSPNFDSLSMQKSSVRETKMRDAVKALITTYITDNPDITIAQLVKKSGLSQGLVNDLVLEQSAKTTGMLRRKEHKGVVLNSEGT